MSSTAPPRPRGHRFDAFLAPLSEQEFFERYWEKRPVRVQGDGASARHRGLLSLADVDRYLALARHNLSSFVSIIQVGQPVQRTRVADVEPRQLYRAFHAGSTLLFEGMDRVWPPLHDLAHMLGQALSARIQINAYLSPPAAQGAHLHPDIHDVFVVHLENAKHWWLYEHRVYEPIEGLTYKRELPAGLSKRAYEREEVDIPVAEEMVMEAGDLLYLPRGVVHKAAALEDAHSLHLAIVVTPIHWVEVIKAAAEVASARHPELSRVLPPGFESRDPAALADALRATFRQALDMLGEDGVLEHTLSILRGERMDASVHAGDGQFEQVARAGELELSSWVERRSGQHCAVEVTERAASIRFGGGRMDGPVRLGPAFEFIREHRRFQVADVPGALGDDSKLVLIRRLIREGLLRMDLPGDRADR